MVNRLRRVDDENTMRVFRNIECFIIIDMHGIRDRDRKLFKRTLRFSLYILYGRTNDHHNTSSKYLFFLLGQNLLDSENNLENLYQRRQRDYCFMRHGAMYVRVLYNHFRTKKEAISCMTRFINAVDLISRSEL